ncbi:MAG: hypothetical protein J2O44_05110 [Porphyrobacter sp.]|nr:hypothetical protein [Porphyrobacter sp.]
MVRFCSLGGGLVLAALIAAPAGAADTVAGWDLTAKGKTCTMASTFEDDVTVGLIWSPTTGELGFMATLPQPDRIAAQKTAALVLSFDGHGPFNEWDDERAKVVSGAGNVAVVANWGKAHADDLARTVAGATRVHVRIGEREIGSYDLSGNQAAYRALLNCGKQLAGR